MLVIGFITMGVLAISSVHKRLERFYSVKEHLIFDNLFTISNFNQDSTQIIHPSGDTSFVKNIPWGSYLLSNVITKNKNQFIEHTAIKGYVCEKDLPALEVFQIKSDIFLAGNSYLAGDIVLPKNKITYANIPTKTYTDKDYIHQGFKLEKSTVEGLKTLNIEDYERLFRNTNQSIDYLPKDSVFSFRGITTTYTSFKTIYLTQALSGNLIVRSYDKIVVKSSSQLENILLIAPEIIFEKEVKGTIQAYASSKIVLEDHVSLLYPSSLVLLKTGNPEKKSIVEIGEYSKIIGSIYMSSPLQKNFYDIELYTKSNSLIGGIVYNQGSSDLKGTIVGSLFTGYLNTVFQGRLFENTLIDTKVSFKELPKDFLYPFWVNKSTKKQSKIISTF